MVTSSEFFRTKYLENICSIIQNYLSNSTNNTLFIILKTFFQTAYLLEGLGHFNEHNFEFKSQAHLLDKKSSKCSRCGRCNHMARDHSGGKCDGAEEWQSSQDILSRQVSLVRTISAFFSTVAPGRYYLPRPSRDNYILFPDVTDI